MKIIDISDVDRIGEILDYIHDRFFSLDEIRINKEERTLSIPLTVIETEEEIREKVYFRFFRRWSCPVKKAELVINNVAGFTIKDDAEIGEADINIIWMDGDDLVIQCGIPVIVRVKISSFSIRLVIHDEIVDEVRRLDIGRR